MILTRRSASVFLTALLALVTVPAAAAAKPPPSPAEPGQATQAPSDAERQRVVDQPQLMTGPNGPHMHSAFNVNKCLDVYYGTGPWVQVYDCHGGANQQWYVFTYVDTTVDVFTVASDGRYMCLDGYAGQGIQMIWYTCDGSTDQRFERVGSTYEFALRSVDHPGLCVDVANLTGPPVVLWPCHYNGNQVWIWP
jgi:hypothetical protein